MPDKVHRLHEMQSMQRNIQLSYIPFGRWVLILDPDEDLSEGFFENLASKLESIDKDVDFVQIPRLWENQKYDLNNPSDFQPRLIKNSETIKFWRSPHHLTVGYKKTIKPNDWGYIIHRYKTNGKRPEVNKTWYAQMKSQEDLGIYWYNDPNKIIQSRKRS